MALAFVIPSAYGLLTLFVFGGTAFVCMMIAEDKKQQQNLTRAGINDEGQRECYYDKDPSPTLSAVAAVCAFIVVVLGNLLAGVPRIFVTMKVFVPYHRIMVSVWYCLAWAASLTSIIIACVLSWMQATHHRTAGQNINTASDPTALADYFAEAPPPAEQLNPLGILCPAVKSGLFASMGFIMLSSVMIWMGFVIMAKTAIEEEEKDSVRVRKEENLDAQAKVLESEMVPHFISSRY